MKPALFLLLAATVAGCTTGNVANYCDRFCQADLAEQRKEKYLANGHTYGRFSAEVREEMGAARQHTTAQYYEGRQGLHITTAGPDLAAYGPVGSSGYLEVVECKRDVNRSGLEQGMRDSFLKVCYDLLPVQHRQALYESDQRVPLQDPPVIIVVPVLDADTRGPARQFIRGQDFFILDVGNPACSRGREYPCLP